MKRDFHITTFVILVLCVVLTACNQSSDNASQTAADSSGQQGITQEEITADLETAQAILPTIGISLSLLPAQDGASSSESPQANLTHRDALMSNLLEENSSSSRYAIGAWNTPADFPSTPQGMFDDGDFDVSGRDYKRYPASGELEDFYGVEGYTAYMELRATDDGWGDYQVTLYVTPTLSTSVRYTKEVYRVTASDWTYYVSPVDGSNDVTAFEEISTSYFDGRTETRTLHWTRWVDGTVYDPDEFSVPASFSDPAYTFPASLTEPTKISAADGNEYSSQTTFSITSPSTDCSEHIRYYCIEETGTEYYVEPTNDFGNSETHSQSYTTKTISYPSSGIEITADTVRRYSIDDQGDKTERAKTVQEYSYGSYTSTTTTTEESLTHDDDTDNRTNFRYAMSTTTETTYSAFYTYTNSYDYVLSLEETAVNSQTYSGTLEVTYNYSSGSRTYAYSASLDEDGLRLSWIGSSSSSLTKYLTADTNFSYEFTNVDHSDASDTLGTITLTLGSGTLTGTYEGGLLYGTYTPNDGSTATELLIGTGFTLAREN